MTQNKVMYLFEDVNMGQSHNGLSAVAKKAGVHIKSLKSGEFVVFVNKARTQIAVVAGTTETNGRGVVAKHKPISGKLDHRAIRTVAEAFGGGIPSMTEKQFKEFAKILSGIEEEATVVVRRRAVGSANASL